MQFKHPEILYFLALLIIPIIVHLFQLQRFVKTPFTNVAFLKKLAIQTRKSSRIKKWLVLATRLGLLASIVLAFAGPYFSKNNIDKQQNTFIYLDNSLSTSAKGTKGNLLQVTAQEIIENASAKDNFTLLTNSKFYKDLTSEELKNELLAVKKTSKQRSLQDVLLKISTHQKNNDLQENILISDFQNTTSNDFKDTKQKFTLVQLQNEQQQNLSIDSVYVSESGTNNYKISTIIHNQGKAQQNIPIAISNGNKLVSKQTFSIEENTTKTVDFSVQKTPTFLGKLQLSIEDTYAFDNSFYFSIATEDKINVLAIGNDNGFLSKIFTQSDFKFVNNTPKNINYNLFEKEQLIILNEVENLPQTLISSLIDFTKKGGNLLVIPSVTSNKNSYNTLFKNLSAGQFNDLQKDSLKVTKINFSHPLLTNVFDKKVANFQYPVTKTHFTATFNNASDVISFENNKGFIKEIKLKNAKLFWVASALNKKNSNFTNSPLIVPVFYNIGEQSLQLSKLFYRVHKPQKIDVKTNLGKDAVLSLKGTKEAFIPLQQTHQNKVSLSTEEQPNTADFYHILKQQDTLKSVAYNYNKSESKLSFLQVDKLSSENIKVSKSIKDTLQNINSQNTIHWYWKWFLALAIVFLLLEILILKFFKV